MGLLPFARPRRSSNAHHHSSLGLLLLSAAFDILDGLVPSLVQTSVLAAVALHPAIRAIQVSIAANALQRCVVAANNAPSIDFFVGETAGRLCTRFGARDGRRDRRKRQAGEARSQITIFIRVLITFGRLGKFRRSFGKVEGRQVRRVGSSYHLSFFFDIFVVPGCECTFSGCMLDLIENSRQYFIRLLVQKVGWFVARAILRCLPLVRVGLGLEHRHINHR